jgi:hypothetical protein
MNLRDWDLRRGVAGGAVAGVIAFVLLIIVIAG